MTSVRAGLVTRSAQRLAADPSRVITRLFVPGQEGFERQDSRAGAVLRRILALDEDEVRSSLDDVVTRFDGRHRDLVGTFHRHARELADRLDTDNKLSEPRMLLLGATFTSEYAIEAAALCNPSIVAHPDQAGTAAGSLRFVMSVRGIGEGHRSSIGFRTGVVDAAGDVTIDDPAPFASVGSVRPTLLDAAVFRSELARLRDPGEAADYILDALGDRFTRADLDEQLDKLQTHLSTRGHAQQTISLIRTIAERTYAVEFDDDTPLSERVLWPAMGAEAAGMEDARFVRFVDDDGSVTFYATYTAYSGSHISQQLLETADFRTFTSTPMVGPPRPTRAWHCFPVASADALPPCRGRTANRIRLPTGPSVHLDERRSLPAAHRSLGGVATRQLRAAHRNRGRVAGAHPRRRSDAHLPDRGDPPRSRGADPDPRSTAAAAAEPGRRRTERLRPQRRLLLRRTRARRNAGDSVRNWGRRHRLRDRATA